MATFEIEWTHERWFRVRIEAKDAQEAEAKFWGGEYENEQEFGQEIQQDVDIKEVV